MLCGVEIDSLSPTLCPAILHRKAGDREQPGDTTIQGHQGPAKDVCQRKWRENISLEIHEKR